MLKFLLCHINIKLFLIVYTFAFIDLYFIVLIVLINNMIPYILYYFINNMHIFLDTVEEAVYHAFYESSM